MSLAVASDPTPIRVDSDGTARVGASRVRLASVLHHYKQGATPEQIRESFPSVSLGDIYGAIAYYLHHRDEVDAYLADLEKEADRIRREVDSRPETQALREKLRASKKPTR